jgi:hypothetical protein
LGDWLERSSRDAGTSRWTFSRISFESAGAACATDRDRTSALTIAMQADRPSPSLTPSYLGSILRREPTEEEAEQQKILDWFVDNKDKFKDGKLIEPKED